MTLIKSITDIPQSKKLAEILPPESADMKILPFTEREYRIVPINDIAVCDREDEMPAWSLAALLNVMKDPELIKTEGKWQIKVWYTVLPFRKTGFDNPIDACYEMILELHKHELL
jgi:hypothetical protein